MNRFKAQGVIYVYPDKPERISKAGRPVFRAKVYQKPKPKKRRKAS